MMMYGYKATRDESDIKPHDPVHRSSKRRSNDNGPVSPYDNGLIKVGNDGLEVALVQDYSDELMNLVGAVSKEAGVGAPNMERLVADYYRWGESDADDNDPDETIGEGGNILKGGLAFQSLEDFRIAFAVRGASRALTHQLVRTRQAAFKQQSQRGSYYGGHPEFRMPESVWGNPKLRESWMRALMVAHRCYNEAVIADIPYEDARYILPEGTTNFILLEYSMRTFLETYAYRACVIFQNEMFQVMWSMRNLLVERHPYLEPHIKITCEKIGKCTYQGPEQVEGTCRFPWAREDNRTHPVPVEIMTKPAEAS